METQTLERTAAAQRDVGLSGRKGSVAKFYRNLVERQPLTLMHRQRPCRLYRELYETPDYLFVDFLLLFVESILYVVPHLAFNRKSRAVFDYNPYGI